MLVGNSLLCIGDFRCRFLGKVVEERDGRLYVPDVLYGDGATIIAFAHLALEAAAVGVYEYAREGVAPVERALAADELQHHPAAFELHLLYAELLCLVAQGDGAYELFAFVGHLVAEAVAHPVAESCQVGLAGYGVELAVEQYALVAVGDIGGGEQQFEVALYEALAHIQAVAAVVFFGQYVGKLLALEFLDCLGNNLLDTTKCDEAYYSYNEKQFLVSSEANVDSLERISAARILLMKIYYQ